jgi:hypothetical protein
MIVFKARFVGFIVVLCPWGDHIIFGRRSNFKEIQLSELFIDLGAPYAATIYLGGGATLFVLGERERPV